MRTSISLIFGLLIPILIASAQGQSRRRAPLHNSRHESTIRNIIQPRFTRDDPLKSGNHTSNVAVIVSSSRYWFNYRHVSNALSIYHLLKRGGISDDNIILMLADDIPCNMRNPFRGKIFTRGANGGLGDDLMEGVDIDYSGTDVTVDAFLRVLLGRNLPGEGESNGLYRRSLPKMDENTNVLVLLTGHGGDNFFKFQDGEELMSNDIASVFSQMHAMKRYNEILFISDTCQAFTMADEIDVPNVYSVGSSLKGQNSYSSHSDPQVGQSVIDKYSKVIKDFIDDAVTMTSSPPSHSSSSLDSATISVMERFNLHDALVRIPMTHGALGANSNVGYTDSLCSRRMNEIPLSDFFAAPLKERELQLKTRQHAASASLWMNKSNITSSEKASVAAQECLLPEAIIENPESKEEVRDGMSVFDVNFIAATAGFILFMKIASRKW